MSVIRFWLSLLSVLNRVKSEQHSPFFSNSPPPIPAIQTQVCQEETLKQPLRAGMSVSFDIPLLRDKRNEKIVMCFCPLFFTTESHRIVFRELPLTGRRVPMDSINRYTTRDKTGCSVVAWTMSLTTDYSRLLPWSRSVVFCMSLLWSTDEMKMTILLLRSGSKT